MIINLHGTKGSGKGAITLGPQWKENGNENKETQNKWYDPDLKFKYAKII